MSNWGVVGDCHNGFKAYGTDRRAQETIDVFSQALKLLEDKEIILFAGDFYNDTSIPNWIHKQIVALRENCSEQVWLVMGGNHDVTKTYSSVSALDVLGEMNNVVVVNSHKAETIEVCGLTILCIPHMRSQTDFIEAIDFEIASGDTWDVVLLHSMVDSKLDLSPNDLNIDLFRLSLLAGRAGHVYIGHQHGPYEPLPNVTVPGSTLEFDFGQLGDKFVYGPKPILLTQPRKMVRIELEPMTPMELIAKLDLSEDSIYRVDIKNIPIENYSSIKTACDLIESQFAGDISFSLYKLGHKELQVTAIDSRLDLLEEFKSFCEINAVTEGRMYRLLQDSVSRVVMEEEA